MLVHRICSTPYAKDLSGTGSRLYGGRWNSPGIPVIYTACSVALAMLESIAHTPSLALLKGFSIVSIAVPDSSRTFEVLQGDLPKGWDQFPAPAGLARRGNSWLLSRQSLLMKVPSVVVPVEYNYLINPQHPDMSKVKIAGVSPLVIDIRVARNLA